MEQIVELLKSIPSSAWVAFFTALLTSTLTLIGVRYTNKSNNGKQKKEDKSDHYESLDAFNKETENLQMRDH